MTKGNRRRATPSKLVLPAVIDPPEQLCFTVLVPNERQHIAAFKGAIFRLAKAYTWQNDPLHKAKGVAAVWSRIFDALEQCQPAELPPIGADEGVEQMIRQNPDNPCELQTSIDGATWCTFADLSKCIQFGTQPGAGSPQPKPGGGEQQYCAQLFANNTLLLPTTVSTGDVITLNSASGAGYDGTEFDFGPLWRCPDGQQFIAGACAGFTALKSGDPIPTAHHMTLIVEINGSYYDLASPVTVPGGISALNAVIQVNDDTLANNQGSYQVCVTVKNNQVSTWTHTFDFTTSRHGWFLEDDGHGTASYVPGSGFEVDTTCALSGCGSMVAQSPVVASYTIQGIEIHYSANNTSSGRQLQYLLAGVPGHTTGLTNAAGSDVVTTDNFGAVIDEIQISVDGDAVGKTATLFKVIVTGQGVDPYLGL